MKMWITKTIIRDEVIDIPDYLASSYSKDFDYITDEEWAARDTFETEKIVNSNAENEKLIEWEIYHVE